MRVEAREGMFERRQLNAILTFLSANDRLVIPNLGELGKPREVRAVLDHLTARGAVLEVLEPSFDSTGAAGGALRAALMLSIRASTPSRQAKIDAISDLQAAGLGPTEIAKRLGVSRMSVWRMLRQIGDGSGQPLSPSATTKDF